MKIQTEKMSQAADGAVGLLQSLGNKSRLMIMCQLIDGEKSVGELAELLQARGIHHLPALGVVKEGQAGHDAAAGSDDLLRYRERPGAAGAGNPVQGLLPAIITQPTFIWALLDQLSALDRVRLKPC